jgi:hypothetical protein|tara:strand:+ start:329 stop:664 length:336 start_codon:yes stop_codon:yes gene_type:complete
VSYLLKREKFFLLRDMTILFYMTDTEKLIREVVLPQLIQLQIEVAALRKHTWPYVQAQKEHNQLTDIETKREFVKSLDNDTIKELLNLKAKFSETSGLQRSEYDILKNHFC